MYIKLQVQFFYLSLTDNHLETKDIIFELFGSWSIHWKKSNEQSDDFLKQDEYLKSFVSKMS